MAELKYLKFYSEEFKTKKDNTKFYLPSRSISSMMLNINNGDELRNLVKDLLDDVK